MRFCGQCGSRLPEAGARPGQRPGERPTPPARGGVLPEGEWHSAAVLWCELEPAPGSDVEAVFETLALVLPGLRKITEAQEGYLVRRPSGLTAVFGAQAVHEDDAVRAVATALGFLQRLRMPVLRGSCRWPCGWRSALAAWWSARLDRRGSRNWLSPARRCRRPSTWPPPRRQGGCG